MLGRWRGDPRLASVRDEKTLEHLPEAERAAWRRLWREVADQWAAKEDSP
jgi:hypothetical protein